MSTKNTPKALQTVLANSYALYLKTQNYHWNVTGQNFKALHELFGAQYEEQALGIDEVAERIRTLGVLVPASFSAFGNGAEISSGNEKAKADAMVQDLHDSNLALVKIMYDAMAVAQKEGDEGTVDMLIGRIKAHEKKAWMLKSSL